MNTFDIIAIRTELQDRFMNKGFTPLSFTNNENEVKQRNLIEDAIDQGLFDDDALQDLTNVWVPYMRRENIGFSLNKYGVLSRFSLYRKDNETIWIIFETSTSKINSNDVKKLLNLLSSRSDITEVIYVTENDIDTEAAKLLQSYKKRINLYYQERLSRVVEPFNIVKVRKTIEEMMVDRGYSPMSFSENSSEISQRNKFEELLSQDFFTFQKMNQFLDNWIPIIKKFNDFYLKQGKNKDSFVPETRLGVLTRFSMFKKNVEGKEHILWVVFNEPNNQDEVGVDDIKSLLSLLSSRKGITDSIFITSNPLGNNAQKQFDANVDKFNIQHYFYSDLEFNPTHHTFVPKHTPLTKTEAKAFLTENKILPFQMPSMIRSDPIVKYYGLKQGDLVKIDRMNLRGDSLVNNYFFYRRVI
jgi:DNA-directed RNA polymerase subunit H (RpoH/RPB5)